MNRIAGTGAALPATVLPSSVLEARMRLQRGTMEAFLGVRERRVASSEQAVSDLALPAAQASLASAGLAAADVGLLVLATSTPDHPVPATAPHLAHRLGLRCPAFDLMNTCSGWLYALAMADAHLRAHRAKAALVVGANILSRRLDWGGDWSTAGLFGDGAASVALVAGDGPGKLRSIALDADGRHADRIQVPAGGSRVPMSSDAVAKGQHLLRIRKEAGMLGDSVRMVTQTARQALDQAGLGASDVTWFLPHQASSRLVQAAAKELGIPPDRTVTHLDRYGNMSAASIPVLLHEHAPKMRNGDLVLLASVAAGMSSAAAVLEW